jgi:hypothetical protein
MTTRTKTTNHSLRPGSAGSPHTQRTTAGPATRRARPRGDERGDPGARLDLPRHDVGSGPHQEGQGRSRRLGPAPGDLVPGPRPRLGREPPLSPAGRRAQQSSARSSAPIRPRPRPLCPARAATAPAATASAEAHLDGKFLLRTDDESLSAEDVALGYTSLYEAGRGWRDLKRSSVNIRPVYHRREDRIRAHVQLCWLALLVLRVAEIRVGDTWRNLHNELDRMTSSPWRPHRAPSPSEASSPRPAAHLERARAGRAAALLRSPRRPTQVRRQRPDQGAFGSVVTRALSQAVAPESPAQWLLLGVRLPSIRGSLGSGSDRRPHRTRKSCHSALGR